MDVQALALATGVEIGLAVLATFGGPHGSLGSWPWALQLPGAFALLLFPESGGFLWRALLVLVIQISCWYVFFTLIRRAKRRRT